MKKTHILLMIALMVVLLVAALQVVTSLSGVVPYWKCSEVYRRYAHVPGVDAAFVKDFPINDTVAVDVTLLRATDSAGWAYLTEAFNISMEVLQYVEAHPEFKKAQNMVLRGHPENQVAIKGKKRVPNLTADDVEIRIIDYMEKEIGTFHTKNANEVSAVLGYNFDNMTTN